MSISSLCPSGTPSVSSSDLPPLPRLLFVASTKSQGGIERHSAALAAALARRGASVQFACVPGSFVATECRAFGVSTVPLTVKNSGDLGAAGRLARLIHAERIGVVHAHSRRDYVVAVLGVALARIALRRRVGLVLHAHMVRPLGDPPALSGRFFAWGADAVAAVSAAVREALLAESQLSPAFVRLIPNGIDLTGFAPPGSGEAARLRAETRAALGLAGHALVLGMVGRLDAKGQKLLLDAVPALLLLCPALQIVLVGGEGTAGEWAAQAAQADAGGFAGRVTFTGPRPDVPALLTAFDVLVHLPDDEAFGLALAEGMAAGLPAVASTVGGCREVVQDGETGLLVPPGDRAALISALSRLLDPVGGPALRAELGRRGRAAAEDCFSQEAQINRLEALYREVCPAAV